MPVQSYRPPLAVYIPPLDDLLDEARPPSPLPAPGGVLRLWNPLREDPPPWCDCPECEAVRRMILARETEATS